ncbi:MAG: hypothetical protein RL160_868 [Bacteroidota bacterium]
MKKLLFIFGLSSASILPAQPKYFYKKMSGTIGTNMAVELDLNRNDTMCSGSYKYLRTDIPIRISGRFRSGGTVVLEELDEQTSRVTAVFKGIWTEPGTVRGTWTSKVNGKSYPFSLKETRNGFATASLQHLEGTDCSYREKVLADPALRAEAGYQDTRCSEFNITALTIGGGNPLIDAEINQAIGQNAFGSEASGTLSGYLLQFRKQAAEYPLIREVSCSLVRNEKNLISVQVNGSGYDAGAAHGFYGFSMMHFNRNSGHLYQLSDLIPEGYQPVLNRIAERLFLEQNGTDGWFFKRGEFSVNENFDIAHDGIRFIYNIYEVGPYSTGISEVFIPYKEISHLVPAESMLRNFMKI